jgi:hypothetical protein
VKKKLNMKISRIFADLQEIKPLRKAENFKRPKHKQNGNTTSLRKVTSCNPKSNFVDKLGKDICITIVSWLDIESAANALVTCRFLKSLTLSFPKDLFQNVSFKDKVLGPDIICGIRVFSSHIKSFHLHFCENLPNNLLNILIDCCRELEDLQMVGIYNYIRFDSNLIKKINSCKKLQKFLVAGSLCVRDQQISKDFEHDFDVLLRNENINLDFGRCMFPQCEVIGESCEECKRIACKNCFPIAVCMSCGLNFCYDCFEVSTCERCLTDFCAKCRPVTYCTVCDKSLCDVCEPFTCNSSFHC